MIFIFLYTFFTLLFLFSSWSEGSLGLICIYFAHKSSSQIAIITIRNFPFTLFFCATKTINKFLHIMRVISVTFSFTTNSLLRQLHKVLGSWSWKRLKWNYNMLKRNKAWHSSMASHSICMNKLYFTGAWQKKQEIYYVHTYIPCVCWREWDGKIGQNKTVSASKWASNYIHIYIGQ